jgi:hypothetical protein
MASVLLQDVYHKRLVLEQLIVRVATLEIARVFERQRTGVFGTSPDAFSTNPLQLWEIQCSASFQQRIFLVCDY